ncbi:MAG: hypothetical protein DRP83_10025 [Planctomycetota bacterium]|nr:MAG: hypothetical protein DRP83_10025 [Planctomycetota bacterium]
MADLNGYNANDYEPTASFDPIPAGKYLAAITASEMKATKKGDGSYLQLELTVMDSNPPGGSGCKGRKVWDRLCINHPNDLTQKIARGSLSAICRAVGVMQPRDSAELHNLPLVISVKCKRRDDTGELANEIKAYLPKKSPQQPAAQAPATHAEPGQDKSPQNSAENTTAPWQR